MSHRFPAATRVTANGIRMAVHETGAGRPVILLHGFPELAWSWRHQLPALARAGYRAIAPDQRGYGGTDQPRAVADYGIDNLLGDLHGLTRALNLERPVFVGHDWGALLAWHMALRHPERMAGLIALNIPFHAAPPVDPIGLMRERLGERFYIVNFQDSDEADRCFAEDVPHFFDVMMRRGQITRAAFEELPKHRRVLDLLAAMEREKSGGEPLLEPAERDVYVRAFEAGGFTGPINWYRNWSRNWQQSRHLEQTVRVPALFIGAVDDVIVAPQHVEAMKPHVPDLELHMIRDCGHWTQQERPEEVNALMLDWLSRRYPA